MFVFLVFIHSMKYAFYSHSFNCNTLRTQILCLIVPFHTQTQSAVNGKQHPDSAGECVRVPQMGEQHWLPVAVTQLPNYTLRSLSTASCRYVHVLVWSKVLTAPPTPFARHPRLVGFFWTTTVNIHKNAYTLERKTISFVHPVCGLVTTTYRPPVVCWIASFYFSE